MRSTVLLLAALVIPGLSAADGFLDPGIGLDVQIEASPRWVIEPTDDAWVDWSSSSNYCEEPRLLLTDSWLEYGAEDARYALVKFPIGSADRAFVGAMIAAERPWAAKLELFANRSFDPANEPVGGSIAVYDVDDDTWSECTVTGASAPPPGALVGSELWDSSGSVVIDVTASVLRVLPEPEDAAVSLKIRIEHPGALKYAEFYSRETGSGPSLVVEGWAPSLGAP